MSLAMAYHMKKRNKAHEMSRGGDVKGVHPESHYSKKGGTSHAGAATRQENHYKEMRQEGDHSDIAGEHKRVLGEMHEMKHKDRKYLAEGGMADDTMHEDDMDPIAKSMKKAFHSPGYAEGGDVKGVHKQHFTKRKNNEGMGGVSSAGFHAAAASSIRKDPDSFRDSNGMAERREAMSKEKHHKILSEMHEMKGHDRKYLAEGGEIDGSMPCENCGHMSGSKKEDYDDEDMVGQIMKKRHGYSKGGEVANEDEPMADSEPAEFDELVKDDGLEFHETGKNSGDEIGDEAEDEDRHDIVSQIMKSRKKKDKMPHPA